MAFDSELTLHPPSARLGGAFKEYADEFARTASRSSGIRSEMRALPPISLVLHGFPEARSQDLSA
jgi:hypothetical protein